MGPAVSRPVYSSQAGFYEQMRGMMRFSQFVQHIGWRRYWPLAGGVLALLAATLMLVPGMGEFSLWNDEVEVILAARNVHTLYDVFQVNAFASRMVHPPLIYVLLRIWMTLVGQTDMALRALSTLGALLTAALIYRVTVDLSRQPGAGLAAVVIFGGMGFARYYIHEVQNYGFLMTAAALLLFFYYRWWTLRRTRYTIGLVLALLFSAYMHYASIYLILALTVHVLLTGFFQIRRWLMVSVIAFVGYLPWLPGLVWTVLLYPTVAASTEASRSAPSSLAGAEFVLRTLLYDGWPYYVVFFGLAALAIVVHWRRSHTQALRKAGFLVVVGAGGLLLPMLGNSVVRIFAPHRLIYLLVVFAVFLGYGFSLFPARLRWVGLGTFLLLTINQPLPAMMPGNWFYRQAMESVARRVEPGDGVFIDFSDALENLPLRYYSEQLLPHGIPYHMVNDPDDVLVNAYLPLNRVWVISRQGAGGPALLQEPSLEPKQWAETESYTVAHFQIALYSAPAGRHAPSLAHINPASLPLPQTFEGQVGLARYEVDNLEVRPGDRITVNLDWSALQPLQQDWAIYLHLIGADFATLYGQGDGSPSYMGTKLSPLYWPVGAIIYDQQALTVDADTPPGVYLLRVGIYSRDTGERLRVEPGDGISPNDGLTIAKIKVN